MPSYNIAHIHEQGADIIIIPLDSSFGNKSSIEQNKIQKELQLRATSAGLAGIVVPVWDDAFGHLFFLAPQNWKGFFDSINMDFIRASINRTLSW